LHLLKVECLPTDLPAVITVDVSSLKEIDDEIRVKDLPVPPGCEILDEPEDLIVKVATHREEVEEAAPAAPAPAEVPIVGETQAPAEGEGEGPAES
jgi:large subunit ribosomal protein L25